MAFNFPFSVHAYQLEEWEQEELKKLKYSQIRKQNGELLFPELSKGQYTKESHV